MLHLYHSDEQWSERDRNVTCLLIGNVGIYTGNNILGTSTQDTTSRRSLLRRRSVAGHEP